MGKRKNRDSKSEQIKYLFSYRQKKSTARISECHVQMVKIALKGGMRGSGQNRVKRRRNLLRNEQHWVNEVREEFDKISDQRLENDTVNW